MALPEFCGDEAIVSQSFPLLDALLNRRSTRPRRLDLPAPTEADLQAIVAAGLRGSDHGQLRPWRLIQIIDRAALAEAFVAAELELRPEGDAEMLDRAQTRAQNGPCLLVLISRIDEVQPEIPTREQWIAVGTALNQMLLAAEAMGFAGGILSGRKTQTSALRVAFSLEQHEQIAGFISLGTATKSPAPISPTDPSPLLTRWPASKR